MHDAKIEEMEKTVQGHAMQLASIGSTLGHLNGSFEEAKEMLKGILETSRKMEVVMERQASHEDRNATEHIHIHNRIDKIEKRCDDIEETHQLKCDLIQPKADKGESAYKGLMWFLAGIGILAITSFYNKIWGNQ